MTYVSVKGRRIWHEVSGAGDPVVLLHGGFSGASSFAAQVGDLETAGFRVHRPERSGHAHSPDTDAPFTYQGMADETIDYLEQEVGAPASLVGWSDGAVVALLVARDRPDLARRVVLIGQYYNSSGRLPGSDLDAFLETPEAVEFLRRGYDPISPDGPEHFEVIYRKSLHMFATEPEIDLETLRDVHVPTLVVQGDRDEVLLAHSQAVADALPEARLAVLPGTHLVPMELPAVLNPLLTWFLSGAKPQGTFDPGAGL